MSVCHNQGFCKPIHTVVVFPLLKCTVWEQPDMKKKKRKKSSTPSTAASQKLTSSAPSVTQCKRLVRFWGEKKSHKPLLRAYSISTSAGPALDKNKRVTECDVHCLLFAYSFLLFITCEHSESAWEQRIHYIIVVNENIEASWLVKYYLYASWTLCVCLVYICTHVHMLKNWITFDRAQTEHNPPWAFPFLAPSASTKMMASSHACTTSRQARRRWKQAPGAMLVIVNRYSQSMNRREGSEHTGIHRTSEFSLG